MDNSVLAAVVRGVSDLSIARVWVPPNRFRPMLLKLQLDSPVIVLPRNVFALTSERQLAEHSLRVELESITSDAVLVRKPLPGFESLGPLLCEELTMLFKALQPFTQSASAHTPHLPLASTTTDLVLTILKSIERPH